MFLLLLMGLGAAGVKAQVRIGGNGAPNAAAVLDLNATDTTNYGTKGLALPRVSLSSETAILAGTANLNGMLVYNSGGTMTSGIYLWNGNQWVGVATSNTNVPWLKTFDNTVELPATAGFGFARVATVGVNSGDWCTPIPAGGWLCHGEANTTFCLNAASTTSPAGPGRVVCYGSR